MMAETDRDIEKLLEDEAQVGEALRKAVRQALRQHKREGNPVATWENDRVVWIPPEQIPDAD